MHYTNNKIIFETIDNTFIAADQNIEKYLVLWQHLHTTKCGGFSIVAVVHALQIQY